MGDTIPRDLRTWGDETGIFFRRWWWTLLVVGLMTWLPPVPAVQVGFNLALLALVGLIAAWAFLTARRMPRQADEKWKRDVGRNILTTWPNVAMRLGLGVQDHTTRGTVYPSISYPAWDEWTCVLQVSIPQGLGREHLQAQTGLLAQAFGASRATVEGSRIESLLLRLEYVDALEEPFRLENDLPWDSKTIAMGIFGSGELWRLRLGPHTLVAGASGSGKASLVWGLLLGLAEPIHSGLVEVWGVDRKGGMELALGRQLLTRFADDAQRSVVLLEEAVEAMQSRARQLAGKTRQHIATIESPTIVILIDELAALTAYETDRDLLRRANSAIAVLASQGRAVGFIVFACLQDPRKETLPARGLFTQTVGLRLRDRMETAMVLGDGAVAAGALCHEISPDTPGVAYVLSEDRGTPERVRAGLITDDMIRDAASRYPAPRQIAIVVPEPVPDSPRPPRTRREPSTTARKETSS